MNTTIVLFNRDLRVADHPALTAAAAGPVVPLFVLDHALLRRGAPNRLRFLLDSLDDLRDSLRSLGADLVVRAGDTGAETVAMVRAVGASAVAASADVSALARLDHTGVTFHAVHPGWADTPGVATSLPAFRRVTGPVLRTPAEGADTMVWLPVAPAEAIGNGGSWHDRRRRSVHHLPWTRRGDEAAERDRLWDWVVARAGVDPAAVLRPPASDLRAS